MKMTVNVSDDVEVIAEGMFFHFNVWGLVLTQLYIYIHEDSKDFYISFIYYVEMYRQKFASLFSALNKYI